MLIRKKILYSTMLLTFTLLLLMYCSLRGVYAYRGLAMSVGGLSHEIQRVGNLTQHVNDLRTYLRPVDSLSTRPPQAPSMQRRKDRVEFLVRLDLLKQELEYHRKRVKQQIIESDPLLATSEIELLRIETIRNAFQRIEDDAYDTTVDRTARIDEQLEELSLSFHELFNFLTDRMYSFRAEVRSRYHTWIALIVVSALASLINVGASFWFFRHSVVQPFKVLLNGSRKIARGGFEHRICLQSKDELAELGDAMNSMTSRFVEIRDSLNQKVQERTRDVVRSEQLASVGFLAAGVAHEINNPLASIAWSAEALESRLHEVLHQVEGGQEDNDTHGFDQEQIDILRKYLKRIQDEAFRCKGITERLLDFSRLGESQKKQETDIHEAVSDVVALVKHLGQYRSRTVRFSGTPGIHAHVSPTEFKQIVLNLLTNSLDACNDGDQVDVTLEPKQDAFVLTVSDRGCGMTEEVLEHLFEPFFTRRRDGRGTGLGLSITYGIVQDHGGTLVPSSPGPGHGATLELTLPLNPIDTEYYEKRQAA